MTATSSLKAFDELASARRQTKGTPLPQIPLDQIGPLPGQPRQIVDEAALAELAESIKQHGVIQPIIVIARRDVAGDDPVRYRLVCGERRWRACRLAGLPSVPAIVRDYGEDEVAVLALLENLQRADLTPLEEAEYLYQLKQKYGWTEEGLGEKLGKTRDYVHMRTRLLNLAPDVLACWREAKDGAVFDALTPSHAILVNQLPEAPLRQTLLAAILQGGVTVAETRRRLEHVKQVEGEAEGVESSQLHEFKQALLAGTPKAEVWAGLGKHKHKREPRVAQVSPFRGPGPALALEDLATHALYLSLTAQASRTVQLAALEEALNQDLAWVRKIARDGLAGA
ncbi:MAG: ParB/RepB/Spo0J family partition protein [Candidatus Sericytochromatia bacterium]|nr:ParB/RepB/Spo0J family partition protein [Candidatus Sericytochromatia bacterium]